MKFTFQLDVIPVKIIVTHFCTFIDGTCCFLQKQIQRPVYQNVDKIKQIAIQYEMR